MEHIVFKVSEKDTKTQTDYFILNVLVCNIKNEIEILRNVLYI